MMLSRHVPSRMAGAAQSGKLPMCTRSIATQTLYPATVASANPRHHIAHTQQASLRPRPPHPRTTRAAPQLNREGTQRDATSQNADGQALPASGCRYGVFGSSAVLYPDHVHNIHIFGCWGNSAAYARSRKVGLPVHIRWHLHAIVRRAVPEPYGAPSSGAVGHRGVDVHWPLGVHRLRIAKKLGRLCTHGIFGDPHPDHGTGHAGKAHVLDGRTTDAGPHRFAAAGAWPQQL